MSHHQALQKPFSERIKINKSIVRLDGGHPGKLLSNFGRKVYRTKYGILKADVYITEEFRDIDWLYHQTKSELKRYKRIQEKDKAYFPKLLDHCENYKWALFEDIDYQRRNIEIPESTLGEIEAVIDKYRLKDIILTDYTSGCHNVVFTKKDLRPIIIDFAL